MVERVWEYPSRISSFETRIDIYTNQTVSRGRGYNTLFLGENKDKRFPVDEIKRILQCPRNQPDLDGKTGSMSFLKLIPLTKLNLELMCAYIEDHESSDESISWDHAKTKRLEYKNGKYPRKYFENQNNGFEFIDIRRVISNELYIDWPWGMERKQLLREGVETKGKFSLLYETVIKASDLKDSVFFMQGEQSFIPWNFPFPIFALGAGLQHNVIPWPWQASYFHEKENYQIINENHQSNFTRAVFNEIYDTLPWKHKVNKAAFFSAVTSVRQVVYEVARHNPELIHAVCSHGGLVPLNPTSNEGLIDLEQIVWNEKTKEKLQQKNQNNPPGYVMNYVPMCHLDQTYHPGHYKYNIISLGHDGLSTANRLAQILSHSYSVILLQESSFSYFFTSRFLPWVHYVPLSYSMADLTEKIQWLQENDEMAQQIARNGQTFADSYLRLEDFYCYTITALEVLGKILQGSDALQPYSKMKKVKVGG